MKEPVTGPEAGEKGVSLGVKNAFYTECDEAKFDEFLGDLFRSVEQVDEHSAAWGRKFVEEAMSYASKLGFAPHRNYKKAARVMGGTDPKDCDEKFVFGRDGKPYFISGPHDTHEKCQRIISILKKNVARTGFITSPPRPMMTGWGLTRTYSDGT